MRHLLNLAQQAFLLRQSAGNSHTPLDNLLLCAFQNTFTNRRTGHYPRRRLHLSGVV